MTTHPTPHSTYDLLYFGDDYSAFVEAKDFLDAIEGVRFQNASDEVHGCRLAVWTPFTREEWLGLLESHGLAPNSLDTAFARMEGP